MTWWIRFKHWLRNVKLLRRCEHCKRWRLRTLYRLSMTAYVTDLPDDDPASPNHTGFLCDRCHEEYVDWWQAMWDEYNAGRG